MFTPGLAGLVLGEYRRLAKPGGEPSRPDQAAGADRTVQSSALALTERETEVLWLVANGLTYPQIAERKSLYK